MQIWNTNRTQHFYLTMNQPKCVPLFRIFCNMKYVCQLTVVFILCSCIYFEYHSRRFLLDFRTHEVRMAFGPSFLVFHKMNVCRQWEYSERAMNFITSSNPCPNLRYKKNTDNAKANKPWSEASYSEYSAKWTHMINKHMIMELRENEGTPTSMTAKVSFVWSI